MPADNPISWFFLAAIGLYGAYKFLLAIITESEEHRKEQESMEFFLESPIDKRNISVYNRYNKEGGRKS